MNTLIIGSNKEPLLYHLPEQYLLIDDGSLIDKLAVPERKAVNYFDVYKDSFNPLKAMDYLKAREFIDVLNAVFPEGENTLTKAKSTYQFLEALCAEPSKLDQLIPDTKDTADAYQKLQTILLSPVLRNVLTRPTTVSFKKTLIARLDRATIGDFDAFVLGNLLISQYQGPVVVPDFGFYAIPSHTRLIRQDRLIAGLTAFSELPHMRHELLTVSRKAASVCTPEDAAVLASYRGLVPHTNEHNDFIHRSISRAA